MNTNLNLSTTRTNPYADPDFREKVRTNAYFLCAIRWYEYAASAPLLDDLPYIPDVKCEKCGQPQYLIGRACPPQGSGEPPVVLHCPDCLTFMSYLQNDPAWWLLKEKTVWPGRIRKQWEEAQELLTQGGRLMKEHEYESAIPLLTKSFKLDPSNAFTAFSLAIAYDVLDQSSKALRFHAKACELDRFPMDYRLCYGEALLKAKKFSKAENVFTEAIESRLRERYNWSFDKDPRAQSPDPDLVKAYIGLGTSYEKLRKWEQAKDAYQKATEEDPDHPMAFWYLGGAYHGLGMPEEAAEALEDAIENKPDRAQIHYELGNEYLALHEPDLAMTCFKDALNIKPDFPEAQLTLAYSFDEQGMTKEAMVLYDHLVEHYPDCIPAYHGLGYGFHKLGQSEEGIVWLKKAIEFSPDEPISYDALGSILIDLGRHEEALEPLKYAWEELQWTSAGYHLGRAYSWMKLYSQAIKVLRELLRKQPVFPNAYFELGNIYELNCKTDRAIECFEKTISQSPGHTEAMLSLGMLYVEACEDAKAKMILEALQILDKPKADALHWKIQTAMQAEIDKIMESES